MRVRHDDDATTLKAHVSSHPPAPRGLWRLLNTPKPIDRGAMRLACAMLLVTYAVIVVVRYEESHQAFFWVRLPICAYAALGIWLARRVTWVSGRAYTVGLAFLLPLQAAYIDGMLGNHVAEVALSALATFVPLVFIQAGRDLIIVDLGLVVGHGVLLALLPSPVVPLPAVALMLGGALATGTVASLQTLVYRARWAEGVEQLEQALDATAEWKDRYEAASLASGQVLYDWDPHADRVTYGGIDEGILGYTAEELAGGVPRWVELIHRDDRAAFERALHCTVDDVLPFHLQYRMHHKNGAVVVVEHSGKLVLDEHQEIVRMVGFVADVTKRTMAEAAHAEEAATSAALARVGRELISSLEAPIVLERLCRLTTEVLDCDLSYTWLWKADESVYTPIAGYGMSAEEWESMRMIRLPSDPSTPLFARLLRDEIAQVTPASVDYPATAEMLAYYGVSRVLCVALRRGAEIIGLHAAGYRSRAAPFTKAQERIAHGMAQLASMALTNAQLVEKLELASRLKSEFVSTMSHELRTPLNVILGYTDMLANDVQSSEHADLLARIRQSGLELLEMIEATLDLNRLAAGKDLPQLEPVALAELWHELAREFAALPRKTAAALRWEPVGIETITTDRRKLKMIIKNLVGNALKFTSVGEVVARCARSDAGVEIAVHDTGVGIPAEELPHIFDMFRQVDSSDKRSYGGAGLGLYIVRQLAEQLGATVEVESERGAGSTFRVVFPVRPPKECTGVAA